MILRIGIPGVVALILATGGAFAQAPAAPAGPAKTAEVTVTALVNDAGMTLYTYTRDAPGVTNCYEQCAVNWPPFMAAADAVPVGDWTIVDRTDGTKMWAYKGWPLYLWLQDTAAGQTTGSGRGGVWFVAVP